MKKRSLLWMKLLAATVFLAALSDCMPPLAPLAKLDSDGSVVMSFLDARGRTITPAVSLDVAIYDISFTRSGQSTVILAGVSGSTSQTEPVYLEPGPWTVTANAKNGQGDLIGVATTEVTVNAGRTTTATLIVLSISGDGTLTLTADTSDLIMGAPAVLGTLTPGGVGGPIGLNFAMEEGSATYTGSIAAGSYLLAIELWGGAEKLASYVDTVLVAANFPTTGNLSFKPKNGSVEVQLVDQLTRPIPVGLSGANETLSAGSTMTVTATPAVPVDSYQWYLDGMPIGGSTADRVTLGSGLETGDFQLTVVVKKGQVYSSENVEFTVIPASGFTAVWTGQWHTMIVKSDGTLWACGLDQEGQLGDVAFPRFRGHPIVHSRCGSQGRGYQVHTTLPLETQPRPTIRKVSRPSHHLSTQLAFCPSPSS